MRRIQLVLAALVIVVTSFAAFAGPVMADDWHSWNDGWRNNWHNWNDREDDWENGWNGWDSWNGWNTWSGWNNWEEVQNCPFWDDTSGAVNRWDCFD